MMLKTLVFAIVVLSSMLSAQAQLTLTEQLIRREVMESDGEWEGSDRVALLAFVGEKFTDEHFELVSHIRAIDWFFVEEVNAKPEVLRWLFKQPVLKKLDILDSGQLIDGLYLVGRSVLGRLEEVRISNTKLSAKSLACISSMHNLKTLEMTDVDIDPAAFTGIAKCTKLTKLVVSALNHIPESTISQIQGKLPKCKIRITSGQNAEGSSSFLGN